MIEQLTIDSLDDGIRVGAIMKKGKHYWRIIHEDDWSLAVHPYPCGCQIFEGESRYTWANFGQVMWYERPVKLRHEPATRQRTCRDYVDWDAS